VFNLFKEKFKNCKRAIVMGNGPSINNYDWDDLKKINTETGNETIFLSCNRISNFYNSNNLVWRPDIFACFTRLSLHNEDWIESIDRCLKDENIYSFVNSKYKDVSNLKSFHNNISFNRNIIETSRFKKIKPNFINIPLDKGIIKTHSATATLFQIINYLNIKEIAIVGQDGYNLPEGENHFNNSYEFEPKDFKRSNNRILNLHIEFKRYFKSKGCVIFNGSQQSILKKVYGFKDIKHFIKS
jgi:hypothetical protein